MEQKFKSDRIHIDNTSNALQTEKVTLQNKIRQLEV